MAGQTLPIDLEDLEPHIIGGVRSCKLLDKGCYGTVHVLRYRGSRSTRYVGKLPRNRTKRMLEIHYKECRILSKLIHTNIVQFVGISFLPSIPIPALVMELLQTSLDRFLEDQRKISFRTKVSILLDVASGLEYLHYTVRPSIIHRDLSAGNILLNQDEKAKIADFGCSKILEPDQPMTPVPGTLAYMPPEASSEYGLPLDMFSFGTLSLYVATRKAPDHNLSKGRIRFLRQENYPLADLIQECLHDNPSQRPTATEAREILQNIHSLNVCSK